MVYGSLLPEKHIGLSSSGNSPSNQIYPKVTTKYAHSNYRRPKMLKEMCKKSLVFATCLSLLSQAPTVYAQEEAPPTDRLVISARLKEPTTLRPETDYNALSVNELMDVDVYVDGAIDPTATYYVIGKEEFENLSDKSEEMVRDRAGFTTKELDGTCSLEDVVLVTYHTFKTEKPISEEAPEGEESGNEQTEVVEDKQMATEDYSFVVSLTANEITDHFKTGTWYQTHEKGVSWLYTLNDEGLIDHLYTESTNLDEYIIDGTFFIPEAINDIPVLSIGSGSDKPFIPQEVYFNTLVIPPTIQVIGENAFYKNKNDFELVTSSLISRIEKKAFFSSNITALKTTGGYIKIEDMAFANCPYLSVVMVLGNFDIGNKSFDGGRFNSSLTDVILLGCGSAGNKAFSNNELLESVLYGNQAGVEISEDTFENCPLDTDNE